jgi:hypothetical protein
MEGLHAGLPHARAGAGEISLGLWLANIATDRQARVYSDDAKGRSQRSIHA